MADKEDMKADDMPEKDDKVEKAEKKPEPKKKTKADKEDEILVKNTIDINPKLEEAAGGTAVFGWGRMNPITSGHEKLVNKIRAVARKENGTPVVFLTHSQDAKKNPLSYDDKVMLAKKAFGSIIQKSKSKTIIQAMQELQKKYKNVILVAGSDRISEFESLLNKYNGKDYTFDSIKIVSAGERDADADDVSGMSASKMREAASTADGVDATWVDSKGKKQPSFRSGLPKKLMRDAQSVYDMVRAGMKLAEELEAHGLLDEAVLNFQQRRQRALTMRRYKSKLSAARKRMARRISSKAKLQKKARKKAIQLIRKKVAGAKGVDYSKLNPAEKMMIDKRVAKRKGAIDRIAKRMLPLVRKADIKRVQGKKSTNEAFEMFLEASQTDETPKKRYHEARKKDGSIKLDRRFRAFRSAAKPMTEAPLQDAQKRLKSQHAKERENLSREHETEMDNLKARGLSQMIRKIRSEENDQIMEWIEDVANDIFDSIELEESKALQSIKEKAEKCGATYEELKKVYTEALEEGDQEWAFSCVNVHIAEGKKKGLWDNIHAKRKRIKAGSGEKMRKPGSDGAPTNQDFKDAREEAVSPAQRAAIAIAKKKKEAIEKKEDGSYTYAKEEDPCWTGYKQVGMKKKNGKEVPNCVPEEVDMNDLFEKYMAHDPWRIKKAASVTVNKKMYDHALKALKDVIARKKKEAGNKGMRHGSGYYAAQIARGYQGVDSRTLENMLDESEIFQEGFIFEEGGAGDRGTPKVTKRYKKDTPGEDVNEAFDAMFSEEVTQKQIQDLEKFADRLLDKFNVDVEFTRHFADRMNDDRNNPAISIPELQRFFKKVAKNKAKDIKAMGDSEAVLNDIQADLNLPVVIKFDRNKEEFEVVNKTIMRKKNFKTPNKVIKY